MNAGAFRPRTKLGMPLFSTDKTDVWPDVFVTLTATKYSCPFSSPVSESRCSPRFASRVSIVDPRLGAVVHRVEIEVALAVRRPAQVSGGRRFPHRPPRARSGCSGAPG